MKEIGKDDGKLVYANEPGSDAIAARVPHYMNWSPDSRKLLIVAQTLHAGLSLFLYEHGVSSSAEHVLDGGPLYTSWSRDSRLVLAHSFRSHYIIDLEGGREINQMPGSASQYMAPSWSNSSNRFAIFRDVDDERQSLIVGDLTSGSARGLTSVAGSAGFSWNPDGRRIALAQALDRRTGYYSGIWLLDSEEDEVSKIIDEQALCFYWSPDGKTLAFITDAESGEGSLRWATYSIEAEEARYLEHFRPSQEQLIAYMFFDQYAQSHSPWAPDSSSLVFSGMLGHQEARTQLPDSPLNGIFLADATGNEPPKQLARGNIGFISSD